jgi:hypothetical protein
MGITTPAPQPGISAGPADPVPVAFIGRTSTLVMQDPAASMRRQVRESEAKLPPGFFISRYFWDIESGGLAIADRGHGSAHEQFTGIGIPRDGGLADLLAEAAGPVPGFAAVICEDIERSGRDTYYALQLEKNSPSPASRCSRRMSRSTSPAPTPPPSWSAASSRAWPSGSGCRSRRRHGGGCVSTRWPAGTSAPRPTGTSRSACRTRCR